MILLEDDLPVSFKSYLVPSNEIYLSQTTRTGLYATPENVGRISLPLAFFLTTLA